MKLKQTSDVFRDSFDVRKKLNAVSNLQNGADTNALEAVTPPKEGYLPHKQYSVFFKISESTDRLSHFKPSEEACNRQENRKKHVDSLALIPQFFG